MRRSRKGRAAMADRKSPAGPRVAPHDAAELSTTPERRDGPEPGIEVASGDVAVRSGPAEPPLVASGMGPAGDEELRRLSERLRRVEDELDGVFETIGRLLASPDASAGRAPSRDVLAERPDNAPARQAGGQRDRIEAELDESFERIRRALGEVRRPATPDP